MIRKLIPLLIIVLGIALGGGAGFMLRPAPEAGDEHADASAEPVLPPEYVKLNNQFIVPVVENGRVVSLVVLALSLEVTQGSTEAIYAIEPKLRDALLQVLFDHANAGGFRGTFTDGMNLIFLRKALLETAQKVVPDIILDVLISDIARQDA